ncbi:DUF732 domain-containing protein [Knoellia sp. LjRoot47]|uniref:DUF732 domain-containing protein n=1 Tax=Knoellia sp. LjRoot47 TaxID=3342330 RepID=UPI003ECE548A
MLTLRTPATLLLGGVLALSLAACGSGSSDDAGTSGSESSTSDTSASGSSPSPTPSNSGIVPENTWASVFKKAIPPLADKSDEQVAAAAKKVCTTFEANPDEATAKAILADLGTTLALDPTQQQIFASGAVTHFCTGQADEWTKASLG